MNSASLRTLSIEICSFSWIPVFLLGALRTFDTLQKYNQEH